MEQLRRDTSADSGLPTAIHASVAQLKDAIVKVQMCRRDEIVNAISRHQHRDVGTPMQKEKGGSSSVSHACWLLLRVCLVYYKALDCRELMEIMELNPPPKT